MVISPRCGQSATSIFVHGELASTAFAASLTAFPALWPTCSSNRLHTDTSGWSRCLLQILERLTVVVTRLHFQVCLSTLGYCRKRGKANSCAHVYGWISLPSLFMEHTQRWTYSFLWIPWTQDRRRKSFIQTRKCPLKLGSQALTSQAAVAMRLCRETWGDSSKIELDL